MTDNRWKTAIAVAAGIVAFLLVQPDVILPPIAKVVLGALSVGFAVVDPNRSHAE